MRIARLDLSAFGPFTKTTLELAAKSDALQIVYGPNEAGKSSTLRALSALLFGVPVRTGDAHVHEMSRLRVGATLLDEAGRAITLVRRKGVKNTLLDAAEQPLDEAVLRGLLGGVDEGLFRQMFGLDHEHLRAGGEALLAGQGQLGESLFSAGTGGRGISLLIASLRDEIEALYKPRGRMPKLNAALEKLSACQRRTKEVMLSPKAFEAQRAALAEARTARDDAIAERHERLAERGRLSRELSLLPLLRRRDALLVELGTHECAATPIDEGLTTVVRDLERRQGSVLSLARELPEKRAEKAMLERDVAELRERLGSAAAGFAALETPVRARLRRLADEERALVAAQAELDRVRAQHARSLAEHEAHCEAPDPVLLGRLSELVTLCERTGLSRDLANMRGDLTKQATLLARESAQLGVTCTSATLVEAAVLDESEVIAIEACAARLERDRERLREASLRDAEQRERLLCERATLLREGELPSLDDLAAARRARDAAFDTLLSEVTSAEATAHVAAFRAALTRTDELADQLRREARRVAALSQLDAQLASLAVQEAQHAREASEVEATHEALVARTERLLAPLGLAFVRPSQLRGVHIRLTALVARAVEVEAQGAALAEATRRASELTDLLRRATSFGLDVGATAQTDDALSYERALEAARAALAREVEAHRAHRVVVERRAELSAKHAEAVAEYDAVVARLAAFRTAYAAQLEALGFARTLAPDEVLACLDDLALLSQKTRVLDSLASALAGHEAAEEALTRDVRAVVARHLPEASELDVDAALAELARRQREQVATARGVAQLRAELAHLDEQLHAHGDGASLEVLKARAEEVDPHEVRARVVELDAELERTTERIGELDQTIGRLDAGRTVLEATDGASASAEEVECELTEARALARRYYEARVALAILQREIERYREAHQGPVLARAGALFPRLTLERYRGLRVEYDERDEPVLTCVRHDDQSVRVSGLSDGTRDQLYLALRVASIERFLANNPALPLILDDAFIHFDDARTAAALEVLAELSGRTQVVFFTHHARMVQIALRALGPARVAVHRLPGVSGVRARDDDGPLFAGMEPLSD